MSYARHLNIKIIGFIILLLGILGYTYFQMHNLVIGPVITIKTPQNGATLFASLTEVVGTTKNISEITINDRRIFIDETGVFKEKLLLSPGYNIITLHAKDKFGRTTNRTLELVYN
ncbi:hypothetical protein HYW58_02725 [Candidatus Kaiserbacteria bacterium]|nr:hypothetical protein [Candidatus Kaiserbacteria bacterium]